MPSTSIVLKIAATTDYLKVLIANDMNKSTLLRSLLDPAVYILYVDTSTIATKAIDTKE